MDAPLVLYSAATWVAYAIAERFYGGVHYAWCSPFYDGAAAARHVNIPPTSSPAEIYRRLEQETRRGDLHSQEVERNRDGIRRGARAKLAKGAISERTMQEILVTLDKATIPDFRPVLFVIPFTRVRKRAIAVDVHERAHPLSLEYRIEALPRGAYDLIEIRR